MMFKQADLKKKKKIQYNLFNKRPKGLKGHLKVMFFVHVSAV